jgi:hypothetical protein
MRLLIENADLREIARDQSCTDRTDLDDPWGAWPWKSDFGLRAAVTSQQGEKSRRGWGWKGNGHSANEATKSQHAAVSSITNDASTIVSELGSAVDGAKKAQN